MYAANVDGKRHTFMASGSLWQDALVLMDRETKSLWSQISGEAIDGELKGKTLSLVPFFHTTFNEFKRQYPKGQLLQKEDRGEHGSGYGNYFDSPDKIGIFGRTNNFTSLPAKALVYGIRYGGKQFAISLDKLSEEGNIWLNDSDPPVLVTYDKENGSAYAFVSSNESNAPVNDFSIKAGKIHDADGNLLEFEELPIISAFWFAWVSFFPNTELIK